MCTNNYSNKERFDQVIEKIKWCSFFASQCSVTCFLHTREIEMNLCDYLVAVIAFLIWSVVGHKRAPCLMVRKKSHLLLVIIIINNNHHSY